MVDLLEQGWAAVRYKKGRWLAGPCASGGHNLQCVIQGSLRSSFQIWEKNGGKNSLSKQPSPFSLVEECVNDTHMLQMAACPPMGEKSNQGYDKPISPVDRNAKPFQELGACERDGDKAVTFL